MVGYYLDLAWRSCRRSKALTALVTGQPAATFVGATSVAMLFNLAKRHRD